MEIDKDILTVVIPCYNAGEFIEDCLGSLLRQKVKSLYKILFINDASTDDSLERAKRKTGALANVTFLEHETTQGLVKCCNKALSLIDTPYFVRLDADDYFSPDAIEKIFEEINSPIKNDFVIFKRWDILNDGIKEIESDSDIYAWIAAGTLFSTDAVKSVKGYSKQYWEEFDLYLKLLETKHSFGSSPYRIYYYRRNSGSMTKNLEENRAGFKRLLEKWGGDTLKKYGDFKKAADYYGVKS
ncbi:MAG: glycosyltransferase family 2 protein [Candidatus Omnitrophica bacterium]|nr:glycosyltransferase family 2 protein [Candidatus Omnitrophota bacterium]